MVIHLPQRGARVGAYEIIEQLGQGGGGYVYKAERGGRYYAVKLLNTLDLDGWTRREVTALVNLPLPNVVRFVGYDRWPNAETGYPCIIMEFVSGLPFGASPRFVGPAQQPINPASAHNLFEDYTDTPRSLPAWGIASRHQGIKHRHSCA